jgi:hypothetical protein
MTRGSSIKLSIRKKRDIGACHSISTFQYRFRYRPRPRMPLVSVRENLCLKKHAGTAEPFSVARPKAVVLAINQVCTFLNLDQLFRLNCLGFRLGFSWTFLKCISSTICPLRIFVILCGSRTCLCPFIATILYSEKLI